MTYKPRVRLGKPTAGPGKKIISLRDVRLASTAGHIMLIEANKPTWIPEKLFLLAAANGCVDYSAKMAKAFSLALADLSQEDVTPDPQHAVREAIRNVLLFGDATHLTNSGCPKVMAVRKALEAEGEKVAIPVTKELVYDLYLQLDAEGGETTAAAAPPQEEDRYASVGDLEDADGVKSAADEETSSELTAELARATASASGEGAGLEE